MENNIKGNITFIARRQTATIFDFLINI
jgi:hypothetical protein